MMVLILKILFILSKYGIDYIHLIQKNSYLVFVVHTPTNSLSINSVKSFKFTLKYTIISLLHVSVFNDHHQGALSVPN